MIPVKMFCSIVRSKTVKKILIFAKAIMYMDIEKKEEKFINQFNQTYLTINNCL